MTGVDSDVVIVGAGLVGLATARAILARDPRLRVSLLEKEPEPARHQSSHNSGVVHSGIYYRPGSRRARLCREGRNLMLRFIHDHAIPHRVCGKLLVATYEHEIPLLEDLFARGKENGLQGLERLSAREIRELEPEATGLTALRVPETSIVDYAEVARVLARELTESGARLRLGEELVAGRRGKDGWELTTRTGTSRARFLVNCAGLQADRVARAVGSDPKGRIVPFRGEYLRIGGSLGNRVRGLVYPVPDPELPFLGVHITPTMNRGILAGPNALLAPSREGYDRSDLSPRDLWDTLTFPGFPRFLLKNPTTEMHELAHSASRAKTLRDIRALIPAVRAEDLSWGFFGIRAQFMDPTGALVDDFAFVPGEGSLHVLNAPSPAATASLSIGEAIAGDVLHRLS